MENKSLSNLKVLIVDDSGHMRSILATVLRGLGVKTILQADNGQTGLDSFESNLPDLVVTDWEMPVVTGPTFVRSIRNPNRGEPAFTPIILVTAHTDRSRVIEAAKLGVHEILTKPISVSGFAQRIERAIFEERPFIMTDRYFGPAPRANLFDLGKPIKIPRQLITDLEQVTGSSADTQIDDDSFVLD